MAQAGIGDPPGTATAGANASDVFMLGGPAAQVDVTFRNIAGNTTDTAFMITALC